MTKYILIPFLFIAAVLSGCNTNSFVSSPVVSKPANWPNSVPLPIGALEPVVNVDQDTIFLQFSLVGEPNLAGQVGDMANLLIANGWREKSKPEYTLEGDAGMAVYERDNNLLDLIINQTSERVDVIIVLTTIAN